MSRLRPWVFGRNLWLTDQSPGAKTLGAQGGGGSWVCGEAQGLTVVNGVT